MKLTHESLHGRWIVAGSEIDQIEAGDELYHFSPPDRFVMKLKQPDGRWHVNHCLYRLTEEGFVYGKPDEIRTVVTAWLESGFLIFRPDHGMETWSRRVPENEAEGEGQHRL